MSTHHQLTITSLKGQIVPTKLVIAALDAEAGLGYEHTRDTWGSAFEDGDHTEIGCAWHSKHMGNFEPETASKLLGEHFQLTYLQHWTDDDNDSGSTREVWINGKMGTLESTSTREVSDVLADINLINPEVVAAIRAMVLEKFPVKS